MSDITGYGETTLSAVSTERIGGITVEYEVSVTGDPARSHIMQAYLDLLLKHHDIALEESLDVWEDMTK